LAVICHTVRARVKGPEDFLETLGPAALGWGVADPLLTCFSPTCVTMIISVINHYVKPHERNDGDTPEKFDPSRPTFQGH